MYSVGLVATYALQHGGTARIRMRQRGWRQQSGSNSAAMGSAPPAVVKLGLAVLLAALQTVFVAQIFVLAFIVVCLLERRPSGGHSHHRHVYISHRILSESQASEAVDVLPEDVEPIDPLPGPKIVNGGYYGYDVHDVAVRWILGEVAEVVRKLRGIVVPTPNAALAVIRIAAVGTHAPAISPSGQLAVPQLFRRARFARVALVATGGPRDTCVAVAWAQFARVAGLLVLIGIRAAFFAFRQFRPVKVSINAGDVVEVSAVQVAMPSLALHLALLSFGDRATHSAVTCPRIAMSVLHVDLARVQAARF